MFFVTLVVSRLALVIYTNPHATVYNAPLIVYLKAFVCTAVNKLEGAESFSKKPITTKQGRATHSALINMDAHVLCITAVQSTHSASLLDDSGFPLHLLMSANKVFHTLHIHSTALTLEQQHLWPKN